MIEPITADEMVAAFGEMQKANMNKANRIIERVARISGITVEQMLGPSTRRHIAWPRQLAMYKIRQDTDYSYPRIGTLFNRDHTTVIYSIRAVDARLQRHAERKMRRLKNTHGWG